MLQGTMYNDISSSIADVLQFKAEKNVGDLEYSGFMISGYELSLLPSRKVVL